MVRTVENRHRYSKISASFKVIPSNTRSELGKEITGQRPLCNWIGQKI